MVFLGFLVVFLGLFGGFPRVVWWFSQGLFVVFLGLFGGFPRVFWWFS